MASKKLMSRKTATIIGVIFVVLVFSAVYYFIETNYQKQYENPPELSIVLPNGEEIQMLKTKYFWNYKGEIKEEELTNISETYEFPEEYIVMTGLTEDNYEKDIYIKSNVKYKTEYVGYSCLEIVEKTGNSSSSGSSSGNVEKMLSKGEYVLGAPRRTGEFVVKLNVDWKDQGTVNYSIKIINFDEETAKVAKDYMNISSEENDKAKELVSKLYANTLLENVELKGKNINLKYEYYIEDSVLKLNNLILFACIPDLEKITYTASHTKTAYYDEETYETKKIELEEKVYTRNEMNSNDMANIDNLLKYMENL